MVTEKISGILDAGWDVILELEHIDWLDSAGITALLAGQKAAEQRQLLFLIAAPSAVTDRALRNARLAKALDLPYLRLMELAGYLDEEQLVEFQARRPKPHPLAGQNLTPEEWREVGAFIKELVARRQRSG